jgi:chorismate synthase
MSNVFGRELRVTVFGESHSAAVGVVIDGLPPGFAVDMRRVREAMARRTPNRSAASTKRREADEAEILSGCLDGVTTGTPLCAVIRNTDARPGDYLRAAELMRPGHADYTGHIKYKGCGDIRGGGHFSGRLTAPLVFAGSVATQVLNERGVCIGAHVKRIGDVEDADFPAYGEPTFRGVEEKGFAVNDDAAGGRMRALVEQAAREDDSLGGVIACAVAGLPAGVGEPFFDSLESELSRMMFSIPAVKGVEFGEGFGFTGMRGSEANDPLYMDRGRVRFSTNHNGGVNGGISNGMPVLFRVAVKPTPSIARSQHTVDISTLEDAEISVRGRHDACIVPRAVEVVKCGAALVLADMLMRGRRL